MSRDFFGIFWASMRVGFVNLIGTTVHSTRWLFSLTRAALLIQTVRAATSTMEVRSPPLARPTIAWKTATGSVKLYEMSSQDLFDYPSFVD